MDDNARPHCTDAVLEAIGSFGMESLSWPPYSPDLNIIENIWAILKDKVYANNRKYETEDEIKEVIEFHWNNMKNDQQLFDSHYLSIVRRIKDCIDAEGGYF